MAIDPDLRQRLLAAALEPDRGGLTRAGRSLHKHGSRNPTAYPRPAGNPAELNRRAAVIVEEILNDDGSSLAYRHVGRYGLLMEVFTPDGRGLRYSGDERFIGFLEPEKQEAGSA